jgi:hypothetical protein
MLLSTALDIIYEKVQELGKQKFWFLLLILLFVIVTLINGVGIVPEEPYQRLSQNPFITRTDIHFNNYWQETVLLPIVAYYLDLTGTITFNLLTFAMIVGAYASFAWLTFRRWGTIVALISTGLLITSPMTTILLSWLGTPDGLTVALTVPILFTNSSILIFLLAILGTANHPAFMIAIMEILVLRWTARDKINIKQFISAAVGIVIGYSIVKLFLSTYDIDVVSRFDFMQLKTISEWISMNMENLPSSLFSLFNIHWLILPLSMIMFFKRDRWFFSLVFFILLLNYGIVFFTLDTTRVFSLISWAVLFICIFHSYNLAILEDGSKVIYQKQYLQALVLIGIVSFFTPRYFAWAGEIHAAPFYKIISHLIH